MNEKKTIVVVGSINTDLVVSAGRLPLAGETISGHAFATHQGGKGANQAVAAARLGRAVVLIGKVGSDAFGAESVRQLTREGIDCAHVAVAPGDSGLALITVGRDGQNTIVVVPGANAQVTPEYVETKRAQIRGAAMVLAQLEIPVESVLRVAMICQEENVPFMLDPAPACTLPAALLAACTWFTPNETEARFFAPQLPQTSDVAAMASALEQLGPRQILLKMGERGAYLAQPGCAGRQVAAYRVHVVDTTAAGDTYNGAFAAALVDGEDAEQSARFAAAAAALSVTREGAQASMPTLDEVRRFLSR